MALAVLLTYSAVYGLQPECSLITLVSTHVEVPRLNNDVARRTAYLVAATVRLLYATTKPVFELAVSPRPVGNEVLQLVTLSSDASLANAWPNFVVEKPLS